SPLPPSPPSTLSPYTTLFRSQLQGTSTTWLFPSRNPGRHLHPRTLSHDMKKMGINTVPFRGAAIFNLIQTMPLSIVHDLTGVGYNTLLRWSEITQRDWTKYPALRLS